MAVLTIKEIHEGRDGGSDIAGEKLRTRVFRAITDTNTDEATTIEAALFSVHGITFGVAHHVETTALCQRIRCENISNSKRIWTVTCIYSNRAISDPLTEPARIQWATEKRRELLVRDYSGNWVCNSAGGPYDPPPEVDDEIDIVRVRKNVSVMPGWWPNGYRRTKNSDPFTVDGLTVNPGKAHMIDRSLSEYKEKSGIPYRELEFSLAIDPNGWDVILLDSGFFEIDPSDATKRRKMTMWDGTEPTTPIPLDGTGFRLVNPSPTNFVVRTHIGYAPVAYASLPLV